MQWTLDLFSQDLLHARVVVTQGIYTDTGQEIEIAFVGCIHQVRAASTLDKNVVARIRSENVFLLEFFDV